MLRQAGVSIAWQRRAACRGAPMEDFFPPAYDDVPPAKMYCVSCPVRIECLAYALAKREPFGIWGGLTPKERRNLSPADRERVRHHAELASLPPGVTKREDDDPAGPTSRPWSRPPARPCAAARLPAQPARRRY
ncbi:MAG TPA: WhiB family transcriptional regulator [Actinomycetota bacterium]